MTSASQSFAPAGEYPRSFRIGGYRVNSYKVFLCIGIYLGTLLSAAVAERSGVSPLRVGMGCLLCGVIGIAGARIYYLVVHLRAHRRSGLAADVWNPERGGGSVFGGLVIVPVTLAFDSFLGVPVATFWDHMAFAIAFGGAWIRFGCVCNGCCVGRESGAWFALRQHDISGVYKRRVPVQWLEIGWWLTAIAGLFWLWPTRLPTGGYGLALLAWYGLGRFWLEPLRERSGALVSGVRIDRVVAAALACVAGSWLLVLSAYK